MLKSRKQRAPKPPTRRERASRARPTPPGATLALLAAVMLLAPPSSAGRDAGAVAWEALRAEVGTFREDTKRRRFRHHYERFAARMRAIAAKHPDSSRADDALFVAAQLTEELFRASRVGKDLEDAVAAYEEMASRYPESNLSDDALYMAARIRLEELGDREGARKNLERIGEMAGADQQTRAAELLSRLPPPPAPPPEPKVASHQPPQDDVGAILSRVKEEMEAADAGVPRVQQRQPEVLPEPPPKGTKARKVYRLRHEKTDDGSVVSLKLAGRVGIEKGQVPATKDKPARIFFDLTPAKIAGKVEPVAPDDGVIARVRAGQFDRDTVRLVVELAGDVEPQLDITKKPFTISLRSQPAPAAAAVVADAAPKATDTKAARAQAESAASKKADKPHVDEDADPKVVKKRLGATGAPGGVSYSAQLGLKVRRIVIDAGHGGHDTGAIGRKGLKEKDVNLQIAKAIKKKIEQKLPGVDVVMTREDDRFIELAERTAIANEAGADLFISIHANANPSRKVSGVETYYLNITHDRYAIRLAARENEHASDGAAISDLEFILADLAMKSNVDDSIRLGRHVQGSVVKSLRQNYQHVNDLGVKHALFFVLLGSRMPAILVETSFLSNRMEEQRLGSKKYRERIADGVVKGVMRFVEERQAMALP